MTLISTTDIAYFETKKALPEVLVTVLIAA